MTASGARIAAAAECLIQKAATAGVAALANDVSNNITVGK